MVNRVERITDDPYKYEYKYSRATSSRYIATTGTGMSGSASRRVSPCCESPPSILPISLARLRDASPCSANFASCEEVSRQACFCLWMRRLFLLCWTSRYVDSVAMERPSCTRSGQGTGVLVAVRIELE
eukprot:scaffold263481_cov48-Prasinocladus_malaysianus.AAC.1